MFTFSSSVQTKVVGTERAHIWTEEKKTRQMLIVHHFPRGSMDGFYFLFLSLFSIFYGEHVLCAKEKVGIDKHVWPRGFGSQVPVAAPDSQDSARIPATCWGDLHLGPPPLRAVPRVPQSSPLFLPLFHFLSALSLLWGTSSALHKRKE